MIDFRSGQNMSLTYLPFFLLEASEWKIGGCQSRDYLNNKQEADIPKIK